MRPRILFLGNPGYGGLLLEELLCFDVEVVGVFHRANGLWPRWKKAYRRYLTSRKKLEEAVHRFPGKIGSLFDERLPLVPFGKDVTSIAAQHGIPIFDGSQVRDRACQQVLRHLEVDVILVATFSEFLPSQMLGIAKLAAINMHPSLLPKYRGGFPEFCAVYDGERTTGITFHLMEDRFDSGNVLLQRRVDILENETTLALKSRLARVACQALPDLLRLITRNELIGQPQHSSSVSYCKLKPDFDRIDRRMTVRQIQNSINACHDVEDIGTPSLLLGHENVEALSYGVTGIPFDAADGRILLDVVRYRHRIYSGEKMRSLARRLGIEYRG